MRARSGELLMRSKEIAAAGTLTFILAVGEGRRVPPLPRCQPKLAVTEAGVVVINRTAIEFKPVVLCFAPRNSKKRAAKTVEHDHGVRITA